jgi:CRP-like cAMP-binding protein
MVNALLAALPENERTALEPHLERVALAFKQVIQEVDEPLAHLWFPSSGVMSMVSTMEDGAVVEVATIGREGMVGLGAVLGTDRMGQQVFCQVIGEADRLPLSGFQRLRSELPGLNLLLLRYAAALVTQIAQGSACNRLHPIEARSARWLLMTHDRVDGDSFELTHDFLAQMLGVTRPSVTIAAGMLQRAGLIRYVRGVVDILDRGRLEDASCECYALITAELARLVQPIARQ